MGNRVKKSSFCGFETTITQCFSKQKLHFNDSDLFLSPETSNFASNRTSKVSKKMADS